MKRNNMTSMDKRLFPKNVFLNMEEYTTLCYSPIFFPYFILPNIASNFLMTELPIVNCTNSNPNPFTDGWTGSPPVILTVCTIYLSTPLLVSITFFS